MKKILSFILALVFSVSFLFGCGGKGESNTPESIEQLEMEKETVPTYLDSTAKNPFIIGLWCQVPQYKFEIDENGDRVGDAIAWTDEELLLNYQNVKESGINLTAVSVGNSDFVRHLNFIEEVGIYTLIDDAQFRNILFDQTITDEEAIRQSQELINRYKEYECFYGHHIVDEPGVTKFEDLKNAKLNEQASSIIGMSFNREYINLPLLARFSFINLKSRAIPYVQVGPEIIYLIKGETNGYEIRNATGYETQLTEWDTYFHKNFSMTINAGIGLEYKLNRRHSLFVDIRYRFEPSMQLLDNRKTSMNSVFTTLSFNL
jgi:hypothetical protein